MRVYEPGPVHRPSAPPVESGPYFYDDFNNLTDKAWIDDSFGNGSAVIYQGKLRLRGLDRFAGAGIHRTEAKGAIADFDLYFEQKYVLYEDYSYVYFYSGSYYVSIYFYPTGDINLYPDASAVRRDVGNYIGTTDTWVLAVRSGLLTVYRNGVPMVTDHALEASVLTPGQMAIYSNATQSIYIDELIILEA